MNATATPAATKATAQLKGLRGVEYAKARYAQIVAREHVQAEDASSSAPAQKTTAPGNPLRRKSVQRVATTFIAEDCTPYQVWQGVAPFADYSDDSEIVVACFNCEGTGRWQGRFETGVCYTCRGRGYNGTEKLSAARAQWAEEIEEFNAKQNHKAAADTVRYLAANGYTVNPDGTVEAPAE